MTTRIPGTRWPADPADPDLVPDVPAVLALPIEEALGPLNELEQRHAPRQLFLKGDRTLLRRVKVSVVGSRKPSAEGAKRAARLARELADANVVVVSGLAHGIDAAAHLAAMDAGGRTIAVIGTPIDQVYPQAHRALQAEIARSHLVVSQFPIGTTVRPRNFPMRNRTMALLVDASVIVEAGDSSGTLSQGWEALRLARPLFILRSVVETSGLTWPSEMIDYGARVLSETSDLFERLPFGEPLAALPA